MKNIYLFIFLLSASIYAQQKTFYEAPIMDGTKLMSMRQSNTYVQEATRFVSNEIYLKNEKISDKYTLFSYVSTAIFFQPLTHEEGHRSVLTELNIGAINVPFFDKDGVAKVIGVSDATLKNLKETDLPNYIRLHTAGLESDYTYLRSMNAKLAFDEQDYKNVKADVITRHIGVGSYYLTSLINQKFSIDETKKPELERDVVGHDIWGMARNIYNPKGKFYRYTKWSELNKEEKRYTRRIAYLSFINFINPSLFGISNFKLKNGNKFSFSLGYSLSPFGDYITQDFYYFHVGKNIKINPYIREYFNKDNFFIAGGIKLHNYELGDNLLINTSFDVWSQPKDLAFRSSSKHLGLGAELNIGYKIYSYKKERDNSFYFNTGISAKTKGFIPESPSLNKDLRFNCGLIYRISEN
ncbi:hypothetical protein MWN41_08225 [Ornithobacterium rhinotracheale]|uniref:hypothetical protein n=1 Tax=Ornithobacterium rhinotracheale TaxID=28251 RepID=UPI001FF67B61|nr:hypothetical protein [Ornithobacterium rhinotracheale]MCK0202999.1 hypothetical protein [Ornithobacterium rhinotracheale]